MKFPLVLFAIWITPFLLCGGNESVEVRTAPATTVASIPIPIPDGTISLPPVPVEMPDFQKVSTQVKRLEVVEPPAMAGLPPVEGTITQTVHLVEDPKLPDPPPPLPPLPVDDSQVKERLAELAANHRESSILYVSATVYDRSRTLLRCYPSGRTEQEITVWSNIDFNHFCGIGSFEAEDAAGEIRSYVLLMAVGNEDTKLRAEFPTKHDREYELPAIPDLPDGEPAFVIADDASSALGALDASSIRTIADLHALYRTEGPRMAVAHAKRTKAEEARRAFLLANPPKPKDRTVHFWQRDHPVGMPADTIKKEGGN
jgi:hypothetical protein